MEQPWGQVKKPLLFMHDYQNDPEFREMMENAQAEAKSTMRMLASVMVVLMGVLVGLLVYLLMRW